MNPAKAFRLFVALLCLALHPLIAFGGDAPQQENSRADIVSQRQARRIADLRCQQAFGNKTLFDIETYYDEQDVPSVYVFIYQEPGYLGETKPALLDRLADAGEAFEAAKGLIVSGGRDGDYWKVVEGRKRGHEALRLLHQRDAFYSLYVSASRTHMPIIEWRRGLPESYTVRRPVERALRSAGARPGAAIRFHYFGPLDIVASAEEVLPATEDGRAPAGMPERIYLDLAAGLIPIERGSLERRRFRLSPAEIAARSTDRGLGAVWMASDRAQKIAKAWARADSPSVDTPEAQGDPLPDPSTRVVLANVPDFNQWEFENIFPAKDSCVVMAFADVLAYYDEAGNGDYWNLVDYSRFTGSGTHPNGGFGTDAGTRAIDTFLQSLATAVDYDFANGGTLLFRSGAKLQEFTNASSFANNLHFSVDEDGAFGGAWYSTIREHLDAGRPVVIRTTAFCWSSSDGPYPCSPEASGGHAVAVVGYDAANYDEGICVYTNGSGGSYGEVWWDYADLPEKWSWEITAGSAGDPGSLLPPPDLTTPANGDFVNGTGPRLDWSEVSEANRYRLQVATQPDFSGIVVDTEVTESEYTIPASLHPGWSYYWRVVPRNDRDNWCEFGPYHSFQVFAAASTVTGIAPTNGTAAGGTLVTIAGTDFAVGAVVTIGGVGATSVNVVNATTITAVTGAHSPGVVDVVVINPSASPAVLAGAFTYVAPSVAPTVSGITPATGATAGCTLVTITGTNFSGGATVQIGGAGATNVVVVNATTITAVTGVHTAGSVDVVVTNPGGTSGVLPSGYTYMAPSATVSAGVWHTCAVTAGDGVVCWGSNNYGQLGDGTATTRSTPTPVSGLASGVAAVAAGGFHTCALTTSGGVLCWGYNGEGELGDGTTTTMVRSTPTPASGLGSGVAAIAAGDYHTCALTTSGGVVCWGGNWAGQLGDGTTTQRLTPTAVSGLASGVTAIAVGLTHTCGLTTDGGVLCWGSNTAGQLGDGTTTDRWTPTPVSGLGSGVLGIAAGEFHTCAWTTGGGVRCWGRNSEGQLGDGTMTGRLTPTAVSGLGSGVAAVAAGGYHTCGLTTTGGAVCWGGNGEGELGDGSTTQRTTPTAVSGLTSGVESLAAGASHSCAFMTGGDVVCWGRNDYGQLGDGTTTQRTTPTEVSRLSNGVAAVATGGDHTCVLTSGGGAACWGYNSMGQLGDGTRTWRSTPTAVSELASGVAAVVGGEAHTCALTTGGGVVCWGNNWHFEVGDGTQTMRTAPMAVSGLGNGVAAIDAGSYHTCAVTAGGGVVCWGWNNDGQLGDGTTTD